MKQKKIFLLIITSIFILLVAANSGVSAHLDFPPSLSFQADIYGDSNLETIEYLSDLKFYSWGGFGTNAHIFRARLLSSGDEIAYAVSASTKYVFSFEIINDKGERHTIGMSSSDYPSGSVEALSENELHFIWEINEPNFHINLHRYASLEENPDLITGYYVQEQFEIENLGPEFTLMKFTEYLKMDDRARLRDYDADTRAETLLAINNFSTSGYPLFAKVYLRNSEIDTEFTSDGIFATISNPFYSLIHSNSIREVSRAVYLSATEKNGFGAEIQISKDACIMLGCESLPTRWYMRSYRTDDASAMFVNGLMVVGSRYSFPDTGWIDVNRHWKQDSENYLSLASFDIGVCCTSSWGFQLRRNEDIRKDEIGNASPKLGLAFTKVVEVSPDGNYSEYDQSEPEDKLEGDWKLELRVNNGLGFALVDYTPVVGSIKNYLQIINISELLGQKENLIHLNIWGEQSGTLEWYFAIKNGDDTVWQNQVILENAPRERIHHMLLVIDEDGNVYPKFDYPADYINRTRGSVVNFITVFTNRTNAVFDHELPNYETDGYVYIYNGDRVPNPAGAKICQRPYCYDGHSGYDVSQWCSERNSPCLNRLVIYPVADGVILTDETGWINNALGCQIAIDHGNGWKTIYAHLRVRAPEWDPENPGHHVCDGILQTSGYVTRFDQIGIMGCSGSGCAPAYPGAPEPIHLHFETKRLVGDNYKIVDPSGWLPPEKVDPWSARSYTQWLHEISTSQNISNATGGELSLANNMIHVSVPKDYFPESLNFLLSIVPVSDPMGILQNSGISFSLSAIDSMGNEVRKLDKYITVQIHFNSNNKADFIPDTLSLYSWDRESLVWSELPTILDMGNGIASTEVRDLSMIAFMGVKFDKLYLPITSN
jgi:hypothetical protein